MDTKQCKECGAIIPPEKYESTRHSMSPTPVSATDANSIKRADAATNAAIRMMRRLEELESEKTELSTTLEKYESAIGAIREIIESLYT